MAGFKNCMYFEIETVCNGHSRSNKIDLMITGQ